jgi:DNA-directed RNA polymerase subunit RPC12/RpoP
MIAVTCEKCRRRFTPTAEQIQTDLAAAQGKKHAQVACPHCGKPNNIALERLREAVRFTPHTPAAPTPVDQPE